MKLDKLSQIKDLRTVWSNEAKDFTPWLAKEENLSLLSETIGIDIVLEETESSVGSFSLDIFAKEEGTDRKIIIENQLEDTNHDHLGKLITYASGKDASIIIWIVKKARDEHRQAIEWLNSHTDKEIGFYLLEIELWKIGGSNPAPKFNIVERPNDWGKIVKQSTELSTLSSLQLKFWQNFNDFASEYQPFTDIFNIRSALPRGSYDIALGTSIFHILLEARGRQKKEATIGIYISDNKDFFHKLLNDKKYIESKFNSPLIWKEADKASRIFITKSMDFDDENTWVETYKWYCDNAILIKSLIKQYI